MRYVKAEVTLCMAIIEWVFAQIATGERIYRSRRPLSPNFIGYTDRDADIFPLRDVQAETGTGFLPGAAPPEEGVSGRRQVIVRQRKLYNFNP
jgi:hypothetical protein